MAQKNPVGENLEKIAKELEKAGATRWEILKIIKELEDKDFTKNKLEKKSAELLKQSNPKAAETYSSFQNMRVFTSREKIEQFNRGNITKSLLKETKMSPAIAEKISSEVEEKLKSLNLNSFTTAIVRDMAAAKLIEFDQIKTYTDYARLGLPVFDVEQKIIAKKHVSTETRRQYNWIKAIPQKAKELHFQDIISIEAPQDFSTKPFSACFTQKITSEKIQFALLEIQSSFLAKSRATTALPSIMSINNSIAKTIEKKTTAAMKETAEILLEQLKQLYSFRKTGHKPIVSVDLFTAEEFNLTPRQKEKAKEFGIIFVKKFFSKQKMPFEISVSIDSPYKIKFVQDIKDDLLVLNESKARAFPFSRHFVGKNEILNQIIYVNCQKILEKNQRAGEKMVQTCKACQEAINEKEKKVQSEKTENFIAMHGFLGFLQKHQQNRHDQDNIIAEIKKSLRQNTTIAIVKNEDWQDTNQEQKTANRLDNAALNAGIRQTIYAKDMQEIQEIFNSSNAFVFSQKP